MKKIRYIIIFIFIVSSITYFAIRIKESNKIFMEDGILFAMTKDGEEINSFPADGKYKVNIDCKNGKGKYIYDTTDEIWKFRITNIIDKVSCIVDFTTVGNSDFLSLVASTVGTSGIGSIVDEGDAGFRYEGQDPNNYIWFNNELWRIIGVIPTKVDSNGTSKNLVKIIRNESIGGLSYDGKDSGHTGKWGNNTLYSLLNEYYWGKKNGTNTTGCYMYRNTAKAKCDYTKIGIDTTDYYGEMVKKVYWNTGASTENAIASTIYRTEKATQTVYNYIGLMSASDYGYATSEPHSINLSSYNNSNHTLNNWLHGQISGYTNIQSSSTSSNVLVANGLIGNSSVYFNSQIHPVVYLDSNIYVSSGDGSQSNPYILVK